uniref:Uncharacterized protein n=1 Tax=Rheinheimera sp. BAL341 TaxID=1708203 RepID=A0A486XHY7_9GAMM
MFFCRSPDNFLKHYVETEFAERQGKFWQALYQQRSLI